MALGPNIACATVCDGMCIPCFKPGPILSSMFKCIFTSTNSYGCLSFIIALSSSHACIDFLSKTRGNSKGALQYDTLHSSPISTCGYSVISIAWRCERAKFSSRVCLRKCGRVVSLCCVSISKQNAGYSAFDYSAFEPLRQIERT